MLGAVLSLCSAILWLAGCATQEAHWDASKLREETLNYYSDQIMDNLIRAKHGMFILHVDVSNLDAQVSSKIASTIQGGQTLTNTSAVQSTDSNVLTTSASRAPTGLTLGSMLAKTVGVVGTATQMATRPFTVQVNPERDDQVTMSTSPEVNDRTIYQCYMSFLKIQDTTTRLDPLGKFDPQLPLVIKTIAVQNPHDKLQLGEIDATGRAPEDSGDVHYYVPGAIKRWHGKVYYVPFAYHQAYFDLCMALSGRIAGKSAPAGGGGKGGKKKPGVSALFTPTDIKTASLPELVKALEASNASGVAKYIADKLEPEEKQMLLNAKIQVDEKKEAIVEALNSALNGESVQNVTAAGIIPGAEKRLVKPGQFERVNREAIEKALPGIRSLADKAAAARAAERNAPEESSTGDGQLLPEKPGDSTQTRQLRQIRDYILNGVR